MGVEQRLVELARRRAELVAHSAAQRAELSRTCVAWRVPFAIADQGVAAWRFAKGHRALVAGMGVVLAVVRPFRTLKWLKRGWMLWRFFRGATVQSGKQH